MGATAVATCRVRRLQMVKPHYLCLGDVLLSDAIGD